jgi:hypothetical protein
MPPTSNWQFAEVYGSPRSMTISAAAFDAGIALAGAA